MTKLGTAVLDSTFTRYDLYKSIAAIGGLLTLPILQANSVRLEEIARLALTNCKGRRSPTLQVAARWFKLVGARIGHMEDPTEDVFVTRVTFNGKNYRILEGLYEANGHHLQHILHIVDQIPEGDRFVAIKRGCEALLSLSDLLCERANLEAFIDGHALPLKNFPTGNVPTMKRLATLTTFTYRDLDVAGCDVHWLGRFILKPQDQSLQWTLGERNTFDRQPLVDTGSSIIVGLPSALGAALREAVISAFIATDRELPLQMALLRSQTTTLSQNPMIRKARISLPPPAPDAAILPSAPVEIEPGYWIHLILLTDDFKGYEPDGISGASICGRTVAPAVQDEIDRTSEFCLAQPGFKSGLSLIIICGFGRSIGMQACGDKRWLVECASEYDVNIMGWHPQFDFSELIRLSEMERDLASQGFSLVSPNGLLPKIGFAYANDGHLIQHAMMPTELDSGSIVLPTNAALELRGDYHRRSDIHCVTTPEGLPAIVRRKGSSDFRDVDSSRIYYSHQDIHRGILRGVWIYNSCTWWSHLSEIDSADHDLRLRLCRMQCFWLDRAAPILLQALASVPTFLVWRLNMAPWRPISLSEPVTLEPDSLAQSISSRFDQERGAIVTNVGSAFYHGLRNPDNIAEAILVKSFVEHVVAQYRPDVQNVDDVMEKIVPTADVRTIHFFSPQHFRDQVKEKIEKRVIMINQFDDAAIRIGLGRAGVDKRGGIIRGKTACTTILNKITDDAERDLCRDLERFERAAVVVAAVANHEAAAIDRDRWQRTARALTGTPEGESHARDKITDHLARLNAVFLSSRLIIEVALSQCPIGEGLKVADIDLSRLMAKASMVFHLGGYSDAIHYAVMKPELRISPAGEVLIDPTFVDTVMEPMGRAFASREIDRYRHSYAKLTRELDSGTRPLEEIMDRHFLEAWKAEVGISLDDCKLAVEVLENKLVQAGVGWQFMPRMELIAFLAHHIQDAESYISALESMPRKDWKHVHAPFVDKDRQPWRFGRRLALFRRPFLRLCDSEEAPVVIVPGLLRQSLLSMVHNFYSAEIDQELLTSSKMKRWCINAQDEAARKFENGVCEELQRLGWCASSGKSFSEIIGGGLPIDPGDIDVLAWRADGRVVVLECKNLHFAKTPSEVAKQLSKYQGVVSEKGRLDMLAKHLRRVELAETHILAFQNYTGVKATAIEGAMVFSKVVPMIYGEQYVKNDVRHLTFDQLSAL